MPVRLVICREATPRQLSSGSQAAPTEKRRHGAQIGHRSSEVVNDPG